MRRGIEECGEILRSVEKSGDRKVKKAEKN